MNDNDIQRAIETIMRLRPESSERQLNSVKRIEVKRRFDEWVYRQELAH